VAIASNLRTFLSVLLLLLLIFQAAEEKESKVTTIVWNWNKMATK
jgi:hypothetical protein